VQAAHYILGRFGPDSALRRWGLGLAASGGKRGKKRAVVAVARKLAVLLHSMWRNRQPFIPSPNLPRKPPSRLEPTPKTHRKRRKKTTLLQTIHLAFGDCALELGQQRPTNR